jgi:hypothetical protein
MTAALGPAIPTWNGSAWEYIISYAVPPADAALVNNGDKYQVMVATTLSNLSDVNCRFSDATNIVVLNVLDCGNPLTTKLISFAGSIKNNGAALRWTTTTENEPLNFDVEKSYDGINFIQLTTISSYNDYNSILNIYSYTDPELFTGKAYYRIKMRNSYNRAVLSRTVQLSLNPDAFAFVSVINPFSSELLFDVSSDHNGKADAELIDQFGKVVKRSSFAIAVGVNDRIFSNTEILSPGIYILRVQSGESVIQKRVLKQNR